MNIPLMQFYAADQKRTARELSQQPTLSIQFKSRSLNRKITTVKKLMNVRHQIINQDQINKG